MKPNSKTQSDAGLDFDGAKLMSVDRDSRKYHTNAWSGHLNDGRTVNMGRGPTRGNDGSCGHSGFSHTGKMPPTSAVPAVPKQGSVRDNINRGTQQRGGGRAFEPSAGQNYRGNPDRINAGSGPRKGNSQ